MSEPRLGNPERVLGSKEEPRAPHRPSSGTNSNEWLVNVSDEELVPMLTSQVVDALHTGRLNEGSLVWRIGMHDWAMLRDVPQLRLAAGPSSAGDASDEADASTPRVRLEDDSLSVVPVPISSARSSRPMLDESDLVEHGVPVEARLTPVRPIAARLVSDADSGRMLALPGTFTPVSVEADAAPRPEPWTYRRAMRNSDRPELPRRLRKGPLWALFAALGLLGTTLLWLERALGERTHAEQVSEAPSIVPAREAPSLDETRPWLPGAKASERAAPPTSASALSTAPAQTAKPLPGALPRAKKPAASPRPASSALGAELDAPSTTTPPTESTDEPPPGPSNAGPAPTAAEPARPAPPEASGGPSPAAAPAP